MPLGSTTLARPTGVLVSTLSYESAVNDSSIRRAINTAGASSVAWGTANLGLFFPIVCETPFTIVKFFWYTGSDNTGNIDVGIYSDAYAKLLSTGAVGLGTINVLNESDVTDTTFPAGRYYLGVSLANAAGTLTSLAATTSAAVAAAGGFQMASAHALPATATPALFATLLAVPLFGFSQRTVTA